MKRIIIALATLLALSAYATPDRKTNGRGHGTSSTSSQTSSTSTAAALGVGVGIGKGGKAMANAVGGSGGAGGAGGQGGVASATGGAAGAGGQGGAGGTVSGSGNGGGANVDIKASNRAATAFAAPVAGTNGTCMGGTSAGVQGAIGVSFSTTWTDNGCDVRYDVATLLTLGDKDAAKARACLKPEIAKAYEAAGQPCPGTQKKAQGSGQAVTLEGAGESNSVYAGSDPFVLDRLLRQGKY